MQIADWRRQPRADFVRQTFGKDGSALMRALSDHFVVRLFRFSSAPSRIVSASDLTFDGRQTRLAAAIDGARQELAGLPVAGLVLVTDGADTTDASVADALLAPKAQALPVFTVGVGQETLSRDIQIGRLSTPRTVLKGTSLLVDAIVTPNTSLADVVRRCPPFGLSVLPAGRETAIPYEVLKSPRVGELFEEARQHYDYVVLDTPPFVPVPDCRVIAKCVDGFLLIVAAHKTPRKLVEAALDVMDPAQLVGLVFNGDTERPFARYYGHYATHGLSRNGHRTNWWSRVTKRGGDSRLRSEVSQ